MSNAKSAAGEVQPSAAASLFEQMFSEEPSDVYERAGYWRANAKYFASQLDIATGRTAR